MTIIKYNKNLKSFARQNRNDSTKSEVRIWCELLKAKKMLGYSFLRQKPIGNYIADFLCKELKLIIEVDGYSHNFKFKEDKVRTEDLNKLGFTVLRFSDEEVMNDLSNVERTINNWIENKIN